MEILLPASQALKVGTEAAVENPPGNDPYIQALGKGILQIYETQADIASAIDTTLEHRGFMAPAYAFGLVRIALQEQVLHDVQQASDGTNLYRLRHKTRPFDGYEEPAVWVETIREFFEPNSPRRADILAHLKHDTVATTVTRRYILPEIIAGLLRDRVGPSPSVLDIGSSKPIGLVRMALSGRLNGDRPVIPQLSIHFVRPSRPGTETQLEDDPMNAHLQQVYAKTPQISIGVGGDIMPVEDKRIERWVRSSFYPKEYNMAPPHQMHNSLTTVEETSPAEYEMLVKANPENIYAYQADFTKLNYLDLYRFLRQQRIHPAVANFRNGFDLVTLLTMTYELTPSKRQVILQTAGRLASKRGVVIVQDWITQDPADPRSFIAEAASFGEEYKYRTWVIDPRNPDTKPLEVFVSRNGRVQNVMLGKDFEEFCQTYSVRLHAL